MNLKDKRQVIQRFRDIVNFALISNLDVIQERSRLRRKLLAVGWSYENLERLEEIAYARTVYSIQLPGIGKSKGDWQEWIRNKGRWL